MPPLPTRNECGLRPQCSLEFKLEVDFLAPQWFPNPALRSRHPHPEPAETKYIYDDAADNSKVAMKQAAAYDHLQEIHRSIETYAEPAFQSVTHLTRVDGLKVWNPIRDSNSHFGTWEMTNDGPATPMTLKQRTNYPYFTPIRLKSPLNRPTTTPGAIDDIGRTLWAIARDARTFTETTSHLTVKILKRYPFFTLTGLKNLAAILFVLKMRLPSSISRFAEVEDIDTATKLTRIKSGLSTIFTGSRVRKGFQVYQSTN